MAAGGTIMLKSLLAAVAALTLATPAAAEVVERSADHFVLRYTSVMETTQDDLIASVEDIGNWWNPAHTYSGDAHNLSLTLDPGTCFCEALPDGSTFEHGWVSEYDPETGVLLEAPLGPLTGRTPLADWGIGWTGGPSGAGWEVVMTYVVRGPGLGAYADGVDAVMQDQFNRFTRYIHYGPEAPAA
jgi:hypothetical protein